MLIINVKDNESIERALKRYRRKHRNTQLMKELRRRERFVKPSMKRRKELLKAIYREQKAQEMDS
ncbi:MAG: 30S ribosomal protein S21 [Saprospiraceae bacterium]|nr:30S ribosomal protein S21 [Saprospiraceae bacterium]MCB0626195.1 30S ribosomal protein S21 [Saprospiraceae bacterium]MCB0679124.1 30S ribosomal protein S21 [Saprospiraceae bacterium]MCB0683134.1 30S ribosomal protein S21 [Saprospiraceae bacterium]